MWGEELARGRTRQARHVARWQKSGAAAMTAAAAPAAAATARFVAAAAAAPSAAAATTALQQQQEARGGSLRVCGVTRGCAAAVAGYSSLRHMCSSGIACWLWWHGSGGDQHDEGVCSSSSGSSSSR